MRKSLTLQISELEEKKNLYYSSGDTHEIDPDIAKDLFLMMNISR